MHQQLAAILNTLQIKPLQKANVFLLLVLFIFPAFPQSPPEAPVITEPPVDGWVVNPADVHMETAPMSDADGDGHLCSDWEIWSLNPSGRVWFADCVGNLEKVHAHLGDGVFEGSLSGANQLVYDTDYLLRVRHRDDTGAWSVFSERTFRTGSATAIFPMELDDIAETPAPAFTDAEDLPIDLASGSSVRIESASGGLLLAFSADGIDNPAALAAHFPVRAVVNSEAGLALPQSIMSFTDDEGQGRNIYLPSLNIAAMESRYFWISANGSSYYGEETQIEPDFSNLAQGAPVPWQVLQNGYKVEVVASGFRLPVNIAFSPAQSNDPNSPFFYVTELYGSIKVVRRNGIVNNYATGLLNFNPTGNFPGSGEQGLSGIVVDSASGDVFASMLYDAAPPNGPHYPKVVRFSSSDGGLTAASNTVILDMPGENQGQSHFISALTIGPDGKLYVHIGDGFDASTALNLNSFRGKILRVNLDGSAPEDNPFYDAGNGITATDYIFAYGFRNPFGGAWRALDQSLYEVENGPEINDRFAKVIAGENYQWNGDGASLAAFAIYLWNPPHAPANIAFIQPETFAGSNFPAEKFGNAFVTESGPTWASGPQSRGKRIVEFELDAEGNLLSGPRTLVEYNGSGKATAVGLAAGPDGLYFSDLYKDLDYETPIDSGANILRITFVGNADFEANVTSGSAPLTVTFTDVSNVPGAAAWFWSFGDGNTSSAQHPVHTFLEDGIYDIRLEVSGSNGIAVRQKNAFISVGEIQPGLIGEYYDDLNFSGERLTRRDETINFDWVGGSPDPSMDPDQFSIRWSGQVQPDFSENYTFFTRTDDGVRLWINGTLLVDQWIDQAATEHSGNIELVAGNRYSLVMEFYENGGEAVAQLSWQSPSQPKEIIPRSNLFSIAIGVPGPGDPLPIAFALKPNFPNPFNPTTQIPFSLPRQSRVTIKIYDIYGREVITLAQKELFPAGERFMEWDGRDKRGNRLASGIYFYEMNLTSLPDLQTFRDTRKMLLVR